MITSRAFLISSPSLVYYLLFVIYYEKGRLEDCDSVDCVDPDGGTDGTGNYLVHGPRPAVCVKRERKTVEERGCAEKGTSSF